MKILLGDGDGMFYEDKLPRNIIIHVTFNNGKTIQFPYAADKSMSALYGDLAHLDNETITLPVTIPVDFLSTIPPKSISMLASDTLKSINKSIIKEDTSHIIEREDIVTFVRFMVERNKDATCDLSIGKEYRVIEVVGPKGLLQMGNGKAQKVIDGYEVLDDNAATLMRMRVYPGEVELLRKRTPPPELVKPSVEEIINCIQCKEPVACILDGSNFIGECVCGFKMSIERIIEKCSNKKNGKTCGARTSLLSYSEGYIGTCPECQQIVKVEHAPSTN